MAKQESEFLKHEPCPSCGSRNNLARYSDGHGHCFGCGHYEHGEGQTPTKRATMSKELLQGEISALPKRHITEETCAHWNYRVGEMSDGPVHIANYCDEHGQPVAQKIRKPSKDFLFLGAPKKAGLYGQWLWRDHGKMIVITEGEIDALSVSQLQQNKWPVVSVPNGAQGAAKSIAKAIEWLEKFEKVVFMFDMDDPGHEAAEECALLLSPGKAYIARLPLKDANEMLVAGRGKEVIDAIWGAKEFRPDGVVDVASLTDDALRAVEIGRSWPWAGLEKTYGRRLKEVYGFGGGTGVGKSDVFKEVAVHIIQNEKTPVGLIFLEEPPAHTLKTLAGKMVNKRFHVPGQPVDQKELRAAIAKLDGRVFFYDHFGSMTWVTIKEKMRFMARGLGCKDIFLDHLTALAAATELDERKALDKIMAEISALAQELDVTIYYVSHLATPEGKSHEEGGRVMEKHFRGSRSIAYWTHFMFGIERDKQNVEGVTTFRVLKDRYTGDATGVTFGLSYDRETGRLHECELPTDDGDGFKDESASGDF
jgi:twinkle protein